MICNMEKLVRDLANVERQRTPEGAEEALDLFMALRDRAQYLAIELDAARDSLKGYAAEARAGYGSDDVEVDDEPYFSDGGDGVWVSAWLWVRTEEAAD